MSEYLEWVEYHKQNLFPSDHQHFQMARLMHMISPFFMKDAKFTDFFVNVKKTVGKKAKDVLSASADEINNLIRKRHG